MPWGGVVLPDEQTAGWGGGSRFERVSREQREEREHRVIRNVIFRVSGLRATGECGEPEIIGGSGRAIQLRRFRRCYGTLGTVEVQAGVEPQASILPGRCRCGQPEILLTVEPRVSVPVLKGRIGEPSIKAQRNMTDDEFIHMLAEML